MTADYRRAAVFWADARNRGLPTTHHHELDCDVLLGAQVLNRNDPSAIIATTNVGHLSRFTAAAFWSDIGP